MKQKSTNSLKEIELGFKTQSILYKGECIWPMLRLKFNEELRKKSGLKSRTFKLNRKLLWGLLKALFFGIDKIFRLRRYPYWIFSSSDRRKKIYGKYVDRVAGAILKQYPNSILIENPYPLGRHFKKKELDNSRVLGQTVLFAGAKLISLLLPKPKIENEALLEQILKENQISLDYQKILNENRAQYQLMKFLLKFSSPKVVMFVYAASSMGYIKALKEKQIPVVELQHGIINESHYAYNVYKDYGKSLFPDFLFTYGDTEKRIFGKENHFISQDHVFGIGYYFLEEMIHNELKSSRIDLLRKKFQTIVVFSLQEPFASYSFEFLLELARMDNTIGYLIVPRNIEIDYPEIQNVDNLILEKEFNIYECLKFADFHSTINSTCAIEALCFGVPNLLYDFNHWAVDYYKDLLEDEGHTKFIQTPVQFLQIVRENQFYSSEEIKNISTNFIKGDFTKELKKVLETKVLVA